MATFREDYILGKSKEVQKPFLKPNVLHQYATYNTIFTLSGITERELQTRKFLTNPVHDIIARTGGIGESDGKVTTRDFNIFEQTDIPTMDKIKERNEFYEQYQESIDILTRGHDLFIENVSMVSTVGPNAERNLGNFTKMEFEVHEPFGITFIEKVRACTAINGFLDYQDAPILLTIEFKGVDEQGRPYKQHSTNKSHTRKIPILISRVDFDVNEGGAKYTVMAVPYTDLAYDDRYKYPRTGMPISGKDVYEWAINAEIVLAKQMQDEIKEQVRKYPDVYKFEVDREVYENGGAYKNETASTNTNTVNDQDTFYDQDVEAGTGMGADIKTASTIASQGVSVTKWFEDSIRSSLGYQELAQSFWTTYLRSTGNYNDEQLKDTKKVNSILRSKDFETLLLNNQYIKWFKIKTTVETPDPGKIDPITKMSPKIIKYRAIPYNIHILKFIAPGTSVANVDWGNKVHKEYNFIYTGDNVDVQGLRINYKTAYYLRNVRGDDKTYVEKGLFTHVGEAFKNVFGRERDPEPLLPLRQYPSTIKGVNKLSSVAGEDNKAQQFYDYLTNPEVDMMRIELEILGDPTYICQDMYVPLGPLNGTDFGSKNEIYDTESAGFNADQFQPIINVRYRLPDDIDEQEGVLFNGQKGKKFRDENLFFNGLYQVNKIDSRFDNGQFLQTLHCSRFNNQQGKGLPVDLVNSSVSELAKIQKDINIADAKKKVYDKITEEYINNERLDDADGNVDGI